MSGSVWVASYVLLWLCVLGLVAAVVALLRQMGVLHASLHPPGVDVAGEGPLLDSEAPLPLDFAYERAALTLLAFTSPSCKACEVLRPSLAAIERSYREVAVHTIDLGDDTRTTFTAFDVRSTPYLVAVDGEGLVRWRGVASSLEQVEELVDEARARVAGTGAAAAVRPGVGSTDERGPSSQAAAQERRA